MDELSGESFFQFSLQIFIAVNDDDSIHESKTIRIISIIFSFISLIYGFSCYYLRNLYNQDPGKFNVMVYMIADLLYFFVIFFFPMSFVGNVICISIFPLPHEEVKFNPEMYYSDQNGLYPKLTIFVDRYTVFSVMYPFVCLVPSCILLLIIFDTKFLFRKLETNHLVYAPNMLVLAFKGKFKHSELLKLRSKHSIIIIFYSLCILTFTALVTMLIKLLDLHKEILCVEKNSLERCTIFLERVARFQSIMTVSAAVGGFALVLASTEYWFIVNKNILIFRFAFVTKDARDTADVEIEMDNLNETRDPEIELNKDIQDEINTE